MSWIVLGLLSAVSAALVAVLAKVGLSKIDPTWATTVRAGIMFVILLGFSLATGKFGEGGWSGKAITVIILSGLAGAASWLFYFWALKSGPTTSVAVLDRLSVVFVLVLSVLFLGDSFNIKTVLAVILMVVAGFLVVK